MPEDSTPEFSDEWADRACPFGVPLYPILDADAIGGIDPGPLLRALAGLGVRIAQLRAKGASSREFFHWVRAGVRGARETGVAVVVNDRVDIAVLADAGGAHVGQDDLSPIRARRLLGQDRILGLSTHSLDEIRAARHAPCDYLALGPVHPTDSKADAAPVIGIEGLRTACRETTGRPLVAIGGIRGERAAAVLAAGASAFAVLSALDASSPARAVDSARALLRAAGKE